MDSSLISRLRRMDWHTVAAVIAALGALVLHLLHIVDGDTLVAVALVLLALLLIRDLHREDREEDLARLAEETSRLVSQVNDTLTPPDAVLIGPRRLREYSDQFAREARGEMTWFNVCLLMFRPQPLFDTLLRPAVENPNVTRIRFVLDAREQQNWQDFVVPKLEQCAGRSKVEEPRWTSLEESVSFVLAEQGNGGRTEAQLSFWGEPFMSRSPGRDIPRYIFHVQAHSELIARLVELDRIYRFER